MRSFGLSRYIYQLCPAETVNRGNAAEIETCFASTPLKFAPAAHGGYTHLVIHEDPAQDYEINATIVEEGGGAGWAVHPWPYATNAPCDWNPSRVGQHCHWGCPRCGAPWWAADGACPDNQCAHSTELPKGINYGNAFKGAADSNTVEDRVIVPHVEKGDYVLRWRCKSSPTTVVSPPQLLMCAHRLMRRGLRGQLTSVDHMQ